MWAHRLARYLLECPDGPVYINGWGSDEGSTREVGGATVEEEVRSDGAIDYIIELGYFEDNKWKLNKEPYMTKTLKQLIKQERHAEMLSIKNRLRELEDNT